MSTNWIKIETLLPSKREVMRMSRIVGQNRFEVSGRLMVVWAWFDQITATGELAGTSFFDIDEIAGCQGFAAAMLQVGWLAGEDGSLQVPKWERHNGNSAKARALEAEAKRLRRMSDDVSDNCPTISAPNVGLDERKMRGRKEKITIDDSDDSVRDRELSSPSSSSPGSSKNVSDGGKGEPPLDLSDVDWPEVIAFAESAARRVPPESSADRRAWLKYAVMAWKMFSEAWLATAADTAATSKAKKTRQALFVRTLQVSAAEQYATPKDVFDGIFSRIRIPTDVWKSNALKPKGVPA